MHQKLSFSLLILISGLFLFSSCNNDDDEISIPMGFASSSYQKEYELLLGSDTLTIQPEILNLPEEARFNWRLEGQHLSGDSRLNFFPTEAGNFILDLVVSTISDSIHRTYKLKVNDPYDLYYRPVTENSSEFISKVLAYKPAPGQYINSTYGSMEDAIDLIGDKTATLSLGAWGGYIIFSFDHTIINREENKDFIIYGNAMKGLSEPGIVKVSFDANGNGLADDEWYELAGSAHYKEGTLFSYGITYSNPGEYANVPWVDSKAVQDSVMINAYHTQNYYPLFIEERSKMSFQGTRVFPKINLDGFASIDALEWGYVDNYDADYASYGGNTMDIDWAVDEQMNLVKLQGIDFVKVYTGAQGNAGWLGEISTEIKGAADLSILE